MNELELFSQRIMSDKDALSRKMAYWRFKSKTFAFVHGYFDVLTIENLEYLANASNDTDRLIVAVYSDKMAKEAGKTLANNENRRVLMLAALRFVNIVIVLDEPVNDMTDFLQPDKIIEGSEF